MSKEYEAKFLNIDIIQTRKKLIQNGAKLEHNFVKFKRTVFKQCNTNIKGYVRVRDEGDKITMTSKIYKDKNFPEEYEITIKENFKVGVNFLKSLGLIQKAYQESYREKWYHPLAHEITFDILPGLPIYMEIDCISESNLNKLIKLLDLNSNFQRYGAFDKTYFEYYGIDPDDINNNSPFLTFNNILNEIKVKKNNNLLKEIFKTYKKIDYHIKNKSLDKFISKYSKIYNKYILDSIKPVKIKKLK